MEQIEKPYNVVLFPNPGYFRHFLVFATDPVAAINKLNYQARQALPIMIEKHGDTYDRVTRLKHIIHATRRWNRKHKPTWAHRDSKFAVVNEIPTSVVHEGQLQFGPHTESLLMNFLPDLIEAPIGNE